MSDPTRATGEAARVDLDAIKQVRDLESYALRLQITLTGLAGGGSENFVRHGDGFRADISACSNKIIARQTETMESVKRFLREAKNERACAEKAEAERDAALARVKELEACLRAYEAWEGHVILYADWEIDHDLPRLTQKQWDALLEIQAERNRLLAGKDGADG